MEEFEESEEEELFSDDALEELRDRLFLARFQLSSFACISGRRFPENTGAGLVAIRRVAS
ncbi:hypothetical protein DPMN_027927 [Dreissena polymorpha]|uniref:Uncharacterized protein n=1 Tax=Dreissena polymorpha TaxID=45954 RepID=A0A9D4LVA8_DREPO|nr:hypothetical protein DPMN_027927 [Dreissena polymorpha]